MFLILTTLSTQYNVIQLLDTILESLENFYALSLDFIFIWRYNNHFLTK